MNYCCKTANISGSASRVLKTALVPYDNMETSIPHSSETSQVITIKLCTFDYVRRTNTWAKFGWYPPARVTAHTYVKYTLLVTFLPSWLPAFLLFFLRTCTGQTDKDNFTHNGSKDAVWRKKMPSQQVFSLIWRFWDKFAPKRPFFDFFHCLTTNNLETFQRISVTKVTCKDKYTF